jgi:predicted nucleic acid-binding protein
MPEKVLYTIRFEVSGPFIGLGTNEVDAVLDALIAVGEPIRLAFHWRPTLKDPSDEMVLETAVNGRADRLVTLNVKHLAPAAREFGLHVGRPGETLKDIRKGSHA